MSAFKASFSSERDWRKACDEALGGQPRFSAGRGLGFLYVTAALAPYLGRMVEYLKDQTGVPHWVGTGAAGICITGREEYDRPALALMLAPFAEQSFRIIPSILGSNDAFIRSSLEWRHAHDGCFAVVHGDPRNAKTAQLVDELSAALDSGFLVGGISSAGDNYTQVADEATEGGISGVLFGSEIGIATGITQGCSLIGHRHEITECERNIVISLDHRPALEVFREDIGEILARDLHRVAGYIFAALPVRGSDTGDYLVRNLIGIDAENGLIAIGDSVTDGMTLQFARRDAQTAEEDLIRMLQGLKKRAGGAPRGGLYHSCLGRGRYLFGEQSRELRLIAQELGAFPLVGFYANGEIFNNRLYGYTGVLTLFL